MGLFSRNDWNVIAVIFQRPDLYQVSGQRAKGSAAKKTRDGAKGHDRTIYWAVFDQKGKFIEGAPGHGANNVPGTTLRQLERDLPMKPVVMEILKTLETGKEDKVSKPLVMPKPGG